MKKLRAILISIFIITTSCDFVGVDCDCDFNNIEMVITNGENTCISDVSIFINGEAPINQIEYYSQSCTYKFQTGDGEMFFEMRKNGDTLKTQIIDIKYEEAECCGGPEDKNIDIKWFEKSTGKEPIIEIE